MQTFLSSLFFPTLEKKDEMDEQQRKTLASKLSALLGFEDGADDVLAHLLTIQTQDVSAEKEHGPVLACLISRTVLVDCQACSCVVVIRDNNITSVIFVFTNNLFACLVTMCRTCWTT